MKQPTLAEQHQQAAEIALEHFRDSVLLAFGAMSDGLEQQYRGQAREIVHFFETETTPAIWQRLKTIPDPETMQPDQMGMVDPMKVRSLADTWIESWERMSNALGSK